MNINSGEKTQIDALDPKRNSFHAIRLMAALQVVYMHGIGHLDLHRGLTFWFAAQFPGVPIFFAVSGFLVLDSFIRQWSAPGYAKSRALRIYPGLAVNILVLDALFWLGGGFALAHLSTLQAIVQEVVYVATGSYTWAFMAVGAQYNHSGDGFFPFYPSGVLWTLTVELTFYVALFSLGWLGRSKRSATIVYGALAIGSLAFLFSTKGSYDTFHWISNVRLTVVPYFWMFALGMVFRLWVTEIVRFRAGVPILAAAVFITAWACDFSAPHWQAQADALGAIRTGMVCLLAVWLGTTGLFKSETLARNDVSYGVYLWHMLFMTTAMALGLTGSYWELVVVMVLAAAAAWLSWRFIEKPMLALKKPRGDRPQRPAADPQAL